MWVKFVWWIIFQTYPPPTHPARHPPSKCPPRSAPSHILYFIFHEHFTTPPPFVQKIKAKTINQIQFLVYTFWFPPPTLVTPPSIKVHYQKWHRYLFLWQNKNNFTKFTMNKSNGTNKLNFYFSLFLSLPLSFSRKAEFQWLYFAIRVLTLTFVCLIYVYLYPNISNFIRYIEKKNRLSWNDIDICPLWNYF